MLNEFFNKIFPQNKSKVKEQPAPNRKTQKIYLFEPNQEDLEKIIASPDLEGKAPGYIYFVQEHMNGTFKIGKTKYIEKRMNLFNVKLPFENKLIHLIKTGNHHQTESKFHRHFADKRVEGEWFTLTKEDLAWVKQGHFSQEITQTIYNQIPENNTTDSKNKQLTKKQIDYAKSMISKLDKEYALSVDLSALTQSDLNRLRVYFRYKNKGALDNLVKEGKLRVRTKK